MYINQSLERIDKILNNRTVGKSTSIGFRSKRTMSSFQAKPIEQTILRRNLLFIQGSQSSVGQTHKQTIQFRIPQRIMNIGKSDKSHNLIRVRSIQSETAELSEDNKQASMSRTQLSVDQQRPKSRTNCRVIEQQNDSMKQRYQMLHLNFLKVMKQYRSCYGIPISEFIQQHKFITLINIELQFKILSIFNIDCTNKYEVVAYSKYKLFKKIIIWKDANVLELCDKILELFKDNTGGELLQTLNSITEVQPYKYIGNMKVDRDMLFISKQVKFITNLCIQFVLNNGNFNQQINIPIFKNLLLENKISINQFIDLITGQ